MFCLATKYSYFELGKNHPNLREFFHKESASHYCSNDLHDQSTNYVDLMDQF